MEGQIVQHQVIQDPIANHQQITPLIERHFLIANVKEIVPLLQVHHQGGGLNPIERKKLDSHRLSDLLTACSFV